MITPMRLTPDEVSEIKSIAKWWEEAGSIIGLRLSGWTFKSSAMFIDEETDETVNLTGAVAARLHELNKRIQYERID